MIHFFPRFSKTAEDTPFGWAVRALGVEHRIFGAVVQQTYRYRSQLLLIGYPVLAWATLRVARKSLLSREDPPPDAVVLSSDVEVLIFGLLRLLPWAAKPQIVLTPFIFTVRRSGVANNLRLAYYRMVLRFVTCAICHSSLEVERYRVLFAGCGTDFTFVRWGTHVMPAAEIVARTGPLPPRNEVPIIVSAGRSGRDYPTLAAATADLPCRVVVICNEIAALRGVAASANVEVLRDCFGVDYLRQILLADVVVVPLRVADISAGQMVLIQAMALARPLVVTRTPTIEDYLQDNVTALLVPSGEPGALRAALRQLIADPSLAAALGQAARADYLARFSGQAHMRGMVAAIERALHTNAL